MHCPDCLNNLNEADFRGIKIQECGICRGRWFARQELSKAKDHVDQDLRWLDFDPFAKDAAKFAVPPEQKQCPHCERKMDSLTYERSGVVINRCLECQGVWVHHDEFEKIIQYLEHLLVSRPSQQYLVDSMRQFLELATGKEDFVSELKDFLVVLKLSELRVGVEHPNVASAIKKIYEYLPFI